MEFALIFIPAKNYDRFFRQEERFVWARILQCEEEFSGVRDWLRQRNCFLGLLDFPLDFPIFLELFIYYNNFYWSRFYYYYYFLFVIKEIRFSCTLFYINLVKIEFLLYETKFQSGKLSKEKKNDLGRKGKKGKMRNNCHSSNERPRRMCKLLDKMIENRVDNRHKFPQKEGSSNI